MWQILWQTLIYLASAAWWALVLGSIDLGPLVDALTELLGRALLACLGIGVTVLTCILLAARIVRNTRASPSPPTAV